MATGIATFLATPSSANLISAVTDETGTGALVFGTSPTLVTPALGTPSALVGTNITGTAAGLTAGNVTINANLTGDVTSVGNATTIAAAAVTLAKMANMATGSLIYRKTAAAGPPEVNTLATLKTDLGLTGTNSGDQTITLTGGVTGSGTGSFAATVITNANLTGDVTSSGNTTAYNNLVPVAKGGLNFSSYTIGDLIQASAAGVLAKLSSVATGNALISGGVGTISSWGKVGLTTHVSGTLPVANGGTNNTAFATTNGVGYYDGSKIAVSSNLQFDGSRLGIGGSPITVSLFSIQTADVNGYGIHVENSSATAGSGAAKYGWWRQMGTTGFGVTDWPNAMVIEGGAAGGLTLSTDGGKLTFQISRTTRMQFDNASATVTYQDGLNTALGTTTGTKFGTAASQKLGFWNATPIVQPTTGVAAATFVTNSGTGINDASTFDGYTLKQVVKALRNTGILG